MKKVLVMFIVITVLMAGSFISRIVNLKYQNSKVEKNVENPTFPQYYTNKTGKVSINAEIITNGINVNNGGIKKQVANMQIVRKKQIYNLLFEGTIVEKKLELGKKLKSSETGIEYYGNAGEFLRLSSSTVYFYKALYPSVLRYFHLNTADEQYNADKYLVNNDLDFATREEAYTDIKNQLKNVGIILNDVYCKCYVLDYNKVVTNAGEKNELTEIKDSYYFVIRQKYNAIPVYYPYLERTTEITDDNTPIQILYSQDGIEFLSIDPTFIFTETMEKSNTLKTLDEVIMSLSQKYNQLLSSAKYSVNKGELYYMVIQTKKEEYELLPVWIFDIVETSSTGDLEYQEIYNAITAEEIVSK